MKHYILILFFLQTARSLFGQWATNPATNDAFNTNGSGRIGIGTNAPTEKLNIYDNGPTRVLIGNPNTSSGGFTSLSMGISADTDGYSLIQSIKNSGSLYGDLILNSFGGNVGIGTSAPNQKLHVNGNTFIDQTLWVNNGATISADMPDTDPGTSWNGAFSIRNSGGSINTFSRLSFVSASGGFGSIAVRKTGDYTGDMYFQIRNGPGFYQTPLFIRSNGHVGIGNLNPNATLDVNGAIYASQSLEAGGNIAAHGDMEIGRGDGQDTKLRFHNYSSGWYSVGIDMSDGRFKINAGGNIGENDQFSMDWLGNVAIGTASPDAKLTVRGDIHTQEVRVDLTGAIAPDYVFEKDYNLLPLPELEVYINQNKHLPEVPSAKEMEENGLNLKEMNLILLKKVEELTLHLIEQQKHITEQGRKIDQQQEEIIKLKEAIK